MPFYDDSYVVDPADSGVAWVSWDALNRAKTEMRCNLPITDILAAMQRRPEYIGKRTGKNRPRIAGNQTTVFCFVADIFNR